MGRRPGASRWPGLPSPPAAGQLCSWSRTRLRGWAGDAEAPAEEGPVFLELFRHMGKRCKTSRSLSSADSDAKVLSYFRAVAEVARDWVGTAAAY